MTPEERIKANVQAALGRHDKKPVKKQNLFVKNVCKSAKTRSTDLAAVVEACEQLPISDSLCGAYCLICAHNNTQIRERVLANTGDDPGLITYDQMSLATAEQFTPTDFALVAVELTACGVLVLDDDGFYRVALYAE
ncbi:TPA: hypothetical protein LAQ47_004058 [Escherichia coli]|nr:hypothetical protein [Escherichia coli]HBJ1428741.1 hypothetical protein [Escherichia coli]